MTETLRKSEFFIIPPRPAKRPIAREALPGKAAGDIGSLGSRVTLAKRRFRCFDLRRTRTKIWTQKKDARRDFGAPGEQAKKTLVIPDQARNGEFETKVQKFVTPGESALERRALRFFCSLFPDPRRVRRGVPFTKV
jgi:hypothetical protein